MITATDLELRAGSRILLSGATLRVQLVGYDAADLEVLARCFGNAR